MYAINPKNSVTIKPPKKPPDSRAARLAVSRHDPPSSGGEGRTSSGAGLRNDVPVKGADPDDAAARRTFSDGPHVCLLAKRGVDHDQWWKCTEEAEALQRISHAVPLLMLTDRKNFSLFPTKQNCVMVVHWYHVPAARGNSPTNPQDPVHRAAQHAAASPAPSSPLRSSKKPSQMVGHPVDRVGVPGRTT